MMSPTLGWPVSLSSLRQRLRRFAGSRVHVGSLEYFLADTCNLRCGNCAASSPFLREPNFPDFDGFVRALEHLAPVLRADQIKLLGGEPLLNKDICRFIRAARQSKIFGSIRVTTNGLLLSKTKEEFWEIADVVELSVYPATQAMFTAELLDSFRQRAAKHGNRLEVNLHSSFMRAISDTRIPDPAMDQKTFDDCAEAHAWGCHLLYEGRLYRCSRVPTLDRYLRQIGAEHDSFTEDDGIVLDGRAGLAVEIDRYLSSGTPLKACSFCFGTSGAVEAHRQMPLRFVRSRPKNVDVDAVS